MTQLTPEEREIVAAKLRLIRATPEYQKIEQRVVREMLDNLCKGPTHDEQ